MSNAIRTEIGDLRNIINMMNSSNRPSSGKVAIKTSLSEWKKTLDELTPHAKLIFSKDVFARVLSYNVPVKAVEVYSQLRRKEPASPSVVFACSAFQVLLCSLQPRERQSNFSEGTGRMHSELNAVVQNVFYNVSKDRFSLFRTLDNSPVITNVATVMKDENGQHRISRPSWLEMGFVSKAHIDSARALVEAPKQSRKSKVRAPTPSDIASHGALRLHRLLGAHLHHGREYLRYAFFQRVGYLFVSWKEHVMDTDQCSMKMSLREDDNDFELSLDDVPSTMQCSAIPSRQAADTADTSNTKHLRRMFAEWPGMIVDVEHEVHVVSSTGSQRRHSGGEKKVLRKYINLIEVACDVLVEYTRVGSVNLFMRTHPDALKCVMIIAIVIRELCVVYIELSRSNLCTPKIDEVRVHGITLKDLIPAPNCCGSVLENKCLRLTESEYQRYNQIEDTCDDPIGAGGDSAFQMAVIEENPELGIAAI